MIRRTATGIEDLLPQREVYRYKTSSAAELKDRMKTFDAESPESRTVAEEVP